MRSLLAGVVVFLLVGCGGPAGSRIETEKESGVMDCREVAASEATEVAQEKLQEAGVEIPGAATDFSVCLVEYEEFRSVARIGLRLDASDVERIPRSIGDGRIDPIKLAPYEDAMMEGAVLPVDSRAYRVTTSTYFGAVMFQGGSDLDELLILVYHLPSR